MIGLLISVTVCLALAYLALFGVELAVHRWHAHRCHQEHHAWEARRFYSLPTWELEIIVACRHCDTFQAVVETIR